MAPIQEFISRNYKIEKTTHRMETDVEEIHGTSFDKVKPSWLGAIRLCMFPENLGIYSQATAFAFSKEAPCCIEDCQNRVAVGAHVYAKGKLWIIPSCTMHNAVGALQKGAARVKRNSMYLTLDLPKNTILERRENWELWFRKIPTQPYPARDLLLASSALTPQDLNQRQVSETVRNASRRSHERRNAHEESRVDNRQEPYQMNMRAPNERYNLRPRLVHINFAPVKAILHSPGSVSRPRISYQHPGANDSAVDDLFANVQESDNESISRRPLMVRPSPDFPTQHVAYGLAGTPIPLSDLSSSTGASPDEDHLYVYPECDARRTIESMVQHSRIVSPSQMTGSLSATPGRMEQRQNTPPPLAPTPSSRRTDEKHQHGDAQKILGGWISPTASAKLNLPTVHPPPITSSFRKMEQRQTATTPVRFRRNGDGDATVQNSALASGESHSQIGISLMTRGLSTTSGRMEQRQNNPPPLAPTPSSRRTDEKHQHGDAQKSLDGWILPTASAKLDLPMVRPPPITSSFRKMEQRQTATTPVPFRRDGDGDAAVQNRARASGESRSQIGISLMTRGLSTTSGRMEQRQNTQPPLSPIPSSRRTDEKHQHGDAQKSVGERISPTASAKLDLPTVRPPPITSSFRKMEQRQTATTPVPFRRDGDEDAAVQSSARAGSERRSSSTAQSTSAGSPFSRILRTSQED